VEPLSPSIFPKDRNETFNIAFLFNDDFVIDPEGAVSARILVVEDNKDMREYLQEVMDDAGYDSLTAADGLEAMTIIENDKEMIDLLITDVRMPGMQGGELLSLMRAKRSEAPVVVITAFGSIEQAVELVKQGAYQYLTKPFETSDLLSTVADALEKTELQRQQAWERRKAPSKPQKIVGVSRPMQAMFDMMMAAARSSGTVLIIGESGTGKELVARAIHEMSGRKGAFVPVNCAAIPDDLVESEMFGHIGGAFTGARQAREGLVESANGGTLFLDEIGELPLSVQPKLLRALQNGSVRRVGSNTEKQVDIRVLAATNRDLEQDVAEGRFREDLYWRLNVIISSRLLASRITEPRSMFPPKPLPV
jgi:DNA-binding NtrC family response regulator